MKKYLILISLLALGLPIYADIINPNLTSEQIIALREERQKRLIERQRYSLINRVCGDVRSEEDAKNCKKKIYEDYLETINYFERIYER